MKNHFNGPLFLVGMPRSGTKLLRNLINRHSKVDIFSYETCIFPKMIETLESPGFFSSENGFDQLTNFLENANYLYYMKDEGYIIDQEEFRAALSESWKQASWDKIIESVLKFYITVVNRKDQENQDFSADDILIWGDKSPDYIDDVPLFYRIFPDAKFIHIIRDPRDQALSMSKTWGKNPIRSAYYWNKQVGELRDFASEKKMDNYHEVYFEQLLETPEAVLKGICGFIGIEFEESMLSLSKPAENYGDAKNTTKVMKENKEKYLKGFTTGIVKRIEEISYINLKNSIYPIHFAKGAHPLGAAALTFFKMLDVLALIKFRIHEMGLKNAISFIYKARKTEKSF